METIALIRKFVAAIGLGLAVASLVTIWGDVVIARAGGFDYTYEAPARGLLIGLVAIAAVCLIASVLLETERLLATVSALGAVVFGFYAFLPFSLGFGHLSDLRSGSWFGLAGSALIVAGAVPFGSVFSLTKETAGKRLPLLVAWLAGAIGLGLVLFSLDRSLRSEMVPQIGRLETRTFWNSAGVPSGEHTLGIAMIVIAAVALAAAAAAAVTRRRLFYGWAVAASLILLGIALYIPATLAFDELVAMRSGSGLALEGSLLAVAGMAAAALAQRGLVELDWFAARQLVAVAGVGLALAGTWSEVSATAIGSIWASRPLGAVMLILVVIAAGLVVLSFARERKRLLFAASVLGWIIAGFCANTIALVFPKLNSLGPAYWLGLAGGAAIGLSTVSLRPILPQRTALEPALARRRLYASAAVAAGLAAAIVSLWIRVLPNQIVPGQHSITPSYLDFGGDHSLGVVMLVLAGLALVALAGTVFTRLPVVVSVMLAASVALLGLSIYLPSDTLAHLGELRVGAWIAMAGSLLASAGAVAIAYLEKPVESVEETATTSSAASGPRSRGRRAAKGRVPGMRAKKKK